MKTWFALLAAGLFSCNVGMSVSRGDGGNDDGDGSRNRDGASVDRGVVGGDGASSALEADVITDCTMLPVVVRDFWGHALRQPGAGPELTTPPQGILAHPHFGANRTSFGVEKGESDPLGYRIDTMLGSDRKPRLNAMQTATDAMLFTYWYNDAPAYNRRLTRVLELTRQTDGRLTYNNSTFFPANDDGFGNEPQNYASTIGRNYHFTTEVHTTFRYRGGEVFTFTGDDDLYVFVNGRLAIDLGGVHNPLSATISFDAQATQLGIAPGNTYTFDLFHAERSTVQSNFRFETTIECFTPEFIP